MQCNANITLGLLLCEVLVWALPANAQPTNLAPAGTASASSIYSAGYEAANANNGSRWSDPEVIWHSSNTTTEPLWYEVDLGVNQYLDRVEIFPRTSFQNLVKNFTIDVFNTSNQNVFSQGFLPNKTTGDVPWGTSALRNILGSRVRITRNPPHLAGFDDAMTFAEFEVWGQSTPLLNNLALGRPTTSTAPLTGWPGPTDSSLANDGNISGHFWHESVYHSDPDLSTGDPPVYTDPSNNNNGHFWQVELAGPSTINYVNLFARTDDTGSNGSVRISILDSDGTTVVTSADTTLAGTDLGAQRYDLTQVFATNPVGKYVRVEMLDTSKILSLGEVEVFGTPVVGGLHGDFNQNNKVDASDYVLWRKSNGGGTALPNDNGLGTPIGSGHYTLWRSNFGNPPGSGASLEAGTIPEPAAELLAYFATICLATGRRQTRHSSM